MSSPSNLPSGSTYYQLNTPDELSYEKFMSKFHRKSNQIFKEGAAYSEGRSISSIGMTDCITVFALEKTPHQIKAIMAWHLLPELRSETIQNAFDQMAFKNRSYEIYLIGGSTKTTTGKECLLKNIHQALKKFFTNPPVIRQELVNLNMNRANCYVDANLQMDGTFSFCRYQMGED